MMEVRQSDCTNPQQFLFRPRPLEDESLSSWRQRSGLENGFRIYPRRRREPFRTEPDRVDPNTCDWLAQAHAITTGEVANLLLPTTGLGGSSAPASKWIVPLRYTVTANQFGPGACVDCLQGDASPYYRLTWRYAFITVCPKHETALMDRCGQCDGLLWPSCAAQPSLFQEKSRELQECVHCGTDLRLHPSRAGDASAARTILDIMRRDRFEAPGAAVNASDFMDGLAFVAQLHLWQPSASKLGFESAKRVEAAAGATSAPGTVEQLEVQKRHEVVSRSVELLADWPDGFFARLSKAKLGWQHISGIGRRPPPWMATALRQRLSRQRRGITADQVQGEALKLTESGQRPTKAAVARALGCREAIAIDRLLARRTAATRGELSLFIQGLSAEVSRSYRRESSTALAARNCALAGLQVLSGISPHGELPATPRSLLGALNRLAAPIPEAAELARLVRHCVALWLSCAAKLWGLHQDSPFRGARRPSVSSVSIKGSIRRAMQDLDHRLLRDPMVFAQCLKLS